MSDIIDWQDLNDRIVYRIWRTNEIEKHDAEIAAEIAVSEFKKELGYREVKLSSNVTLHKLPNEHMRGFSASREAKKLEGL